MYSAFVSFVIVLKQTGVFFDAAIHQPIFRSDKRKNADTFVPAEKSPSEKLLLFPSPLDTAIVMTRRSYKLPLLNYTFCFKHGTDTIILRPT